MGHNFTKVETPDGFDYTFFSEKSRKLCTVGFDRSVSFSFDEFSETLQQNGYTMLFDAKYIEDPIPQHSPDALIGETIAVIVKDFLHSSSKETYVIYECEAHRDRGVFGKWFDKENPSNLVKRGVVVEISANGDGEAATPMALGFITTSDNPTLKSAEDDLELFFISFVL